MPFDYKWCARRECLRLLRLGCRASFLLPPAPKATADRPETCGGRCVMHALRVRSTPGLRSLCSLRRGSHPTSLEDGGVITKKLSIRMREGELLMMVREAGIEPAPD